MKSNNSYASYRVHRNKKGLIWITYISADRTIGYGLKTTEGFMKTHLSNF